MISNFHTKDFSEGRPQTIVFVLHGYGADGANLLDLADAFRTSLPKPVFICPDAPFPHEFMPEYGRQWFSLADRDEQKLISGSETARRILLKFVDEMLAKYGLSYKDSIFTGFSQGCMMALYTALKLPAECRCVVGFSGTIVSTEDTIANAKSKPKICMIHGNEDDIVPCALGKFAAKTLKQTGIACEFHELPNLGHSIDERGINIARNFLRNVISES